MSTRFASSPSSSIMLTIIALMIASSLVSIIANGQTNAMYNDTGLYTLTTTSAVYSFSPTGDGSTCSSPPSSSGVLSAVPCIIITIAASTVARPSFGMNVLTYAQQSAFSFGSAPLGTAPYGYAFLPQLSNGYPLGWRISLSLPSPTVSYSFVAFTGLNVPPPIGSLPSVVAYGTITAALAANAIQVCFYETPVPATASDLSTIGGYTTLSAVTTGSGIAIDTYAGTVKITDVARGGSYFLLQVMPAPTPVVLSSNPASPSSPVTYIIIPGGATTMTIIPSITAVMSVGGPIVASMTSVATVLRGAEIFNFLQTTVTANMIAAATTAGVTIMSGAYFQSFYTGAMQQTTINIYTASLVPAITASMLPTLLISQYLPSGRTWTSQSTTWIVDPASVGTTPAWIFSATMANDPYSYALVMPQVAQAQPGTFGTAYALQQGYTSSAATAARVYAPANPGESKVSVNAYASLAGAAVLPTASFTLTNSASYAGISFLGLPAGLGSFPSGSSNVVCSYTMTLSQASPLAFNFNVPQSSTFAFPSYFTNRAVAFTYAIWNGATWALSASASSGCAVNYDSGVAAGVNSPTVLLIFCSYFVFNVEPTLMTTITPASFIMLAYTLSGTTVTAPFATIIAAIVPYYAVGNTVGGSSILLASANYQSMNMLTTNLLPAPFISVRSIFSDGGIISIAYSSNAASQPVLSGYTFVTPIITISINSGTVQSPSIGNLYGFTIGIDVLATSVINANLLTGGIFRLYRWINSSSSWLLQSSQGSYMTYANIGCGTYACITGGGANSYAGDYVMMKSVTAANLATINAMISIPMALVPATILASASNTLYQYTDVRTALCCNTPSITLSPITNVGTGSSAPSIALISSSTLPSSAPPLPSAYTNISWVQATVPLIVYTVIITGTLSYSSLTFVTSPLPATNAVSLSASLTTGYVVVLSLINNTYTPITTSSSPTSYTVDVHNQVVITAPSSSTGAVFVIASPSPLLVLQQSNASYATSYPMINFFSYSPDGNYVYPDTSVTMHSTWPGSRYGGPPPAASFVFDVFTVAQQAALSAGIPPLGYAFLPRVGSMQLGYTTSNSRTARMVYTFLAYANLNVPMPSGSISTSYSTLTAAIIAGNVAVAYYDNQYTAYVILSSPSQYQINTVTGALTISDSQTGGSYMLVQLVSVAAPMSLTFVATVVFPQFMSTPPIALPAIILSKVNATSVPVLTVSLLPIPASSTAAGTLTIDATRSPAGYLPSVTTASANGMTLVSDVYVGTMTIGWVELIGLNFYTNSAIAPVSASMMPTLGWFYWLPDNGGGWQLVSTTVTGASVGFGGNVTLDTSANGNGGYIVSSPMSRWCSLSLCAVFSYVLSSAGSNLVPRLTTYQRQYLQPFGTTSYSAGMPMMPIDILGGVDNTYYTVKPLANATAILATISYMGLTGAAALPAGYEKLISGYSFNMNQSSSITYSFTVAIPSSFVLPITPVGYNTYISTISWTGSSWSQSTSTLRTLASSRQCVVNFNSPSTTILSTTTVYSFCTISTVPISTTMGMGGVQVVLGSMIIPLTSSIPATFVIALYNYNSYYNMIPVMYTSTVPYYSIAASPPINTPVIGVTLTNFLSDGGIASIAMSTNGANEPVKAGYAFVTSIYTISVNTGTVSTPVTGSIYYFTIMIDTSATTIVNGNLLPTAGRSIFVFNNALNAWSALTTTIVGTQLKATVGTWSSSAAPLQVADFVVMTLNPNPYAVKATFNAPANIIASTTTPMVFTYPTAVIGQITSLTISASSVGQMLPTVTLSMLATLPLSYGVAALPDGYTNVQLPFATNPISAFSIVVAGSIIFTNYTVVTVPLSAMQAAAYTNGTIILMLYSNSIYAPFSSSSTTSVSIDVNNKLNIVSSLSSLILVLATVPSAATVVVPKPITPSQPAQFVITSSTSATFAIASAAPGGGSAVVFSNFASTTSTTFTAGVSTNAAAYSAIAVVAARVMISDVYTFTYGGAASSFQSSTLSYNIAASTTGAATSSSTTTVTYSWFRFSTVTTMWVAQPSVYNAATGSVQCVATGFSDWSVQAVVTPTSTGGAASSSTMIVIAGVIGGVIGLIVIMMVGYCIYRRRHPAGKTLSGLPPHSTSPPAGTRTRGGPTGGITTYIAVQMAPAPSASPLPSPSQSPAISPADVIDDQDAMELGGMNPKPTTASRDEIKAVARIRQSVIMQ